MGKTSTKQKPNIFKNPLEAVAGYGSDAVKSVAKASQAEVDTLFTDIIKHSFGESGENSGDNNPHNGEVELFNNSHEKKSETHARAHIEYHDDMRKLGENQRRKENQQAIREIQEALAEIQQLIKSSKALEMEFADFAVMSAPTEVGEYDKKFFTWLATLIRQAREKVEDSGAWLSAVKGKNGKKGQDYWSMSQKHGTSFSMSNERSSATSVG
jgi:hypothetical protein